MTDPFAAAWPGTGGAATGASGPIDYLVPASSATQTSLLALDAAAPIGPVIAAPTSFVSNTHIFSIDDIQGTFSGVKYADDNSIIDTGETVVPAYADKDGNTLYGVDSEFGFHVTDFYGADEKTLDGDYAEGFAGNILNNGDPNDVLGISVRNAETDVFKSGSVLGTWLLGLGGQLVKASTEHYVTMQDVLSDQAYPGDPTAVYQLDNDLRLRDMYETTPGGPVVAGVLNDLYADELGQALQRAIDNKAAGTNPQTYADIDFDRDGVLDTYSTMNVAIRYDADGDGTANWIHVGGVDLDGDGRADIRDQVLNGIGGTADLVDLMDANESTVLNNIAYGDDYSVTVKDDGKLLYRWGSAVKRPNDIRMDTDLNLPSEWTVDLNGNTVPDILEGGHKGYVVTKAELIINHEVTNNPNDQVRPEDYENEAAIGRLPSHYVIRDPDDANNILWVSPVDSYNGEGEALPSYFVLDGNGDVDLDPAIALSHDAVYDPTGRLVGYRNEDAQGNHIGTVLRDMSLVAANAAAGMAFTSSDLSAGYTAAWYTSVDREPFEWSYDKDRSDPYINVFESFRTRDDAETAGYSDYDLVSGPRWRLTPNKFGQDLPGLEVPLTPNSAPPYQKDNIKYVTGTNITTTLNLLDWAADLDGDGKIDASPLAHSLGWMTIDPGRLDENRDGLIDAGWSNVNGTADAGDALPGAPILWAVSPNGVTMTADALDTAVYVKGDRQDSAQVYDMHVEMEYTGVIGDVQHVTGVTHKPMTIGYQGGLHYNAPVVFAMPPTMYGGQVATVAITNVAADGVSLFLDEPNYLDGQHVKEDFSLITLETGNWSLVDGSQVEVGTVNVPAGSTGTGVTSTVTFKQAFAEAPVVLVQLQTANGADWAVVRVGKVTRTGFDFAIQEEEAADGVHAAEIVGYMAVDASQASGIIDWGGVTGQAFSVAGGVTDTGAAFVFDAAMGLDPLVVAGLNSYLGWDPVTLRLAQMTDDTAVATAGFLLQEEQSAGLETAHTPETLAGLAFDSEGFLAGDAMASPVVFNPFTDDFIYA